MSSLNISRIWLLGHLSSLKMRQMNCDSQCGSMTSSTRVLVLQRIIVQRKPQRFNKTNETDAEAELANS